MINYNGFHINPSTFQIYRNGREVFTASWQYCATLQEAKDMIDYSNQEKVEAVRKLPDLGKVQGHCELENGAAEAERFGEWMSNEHEKQLNEDER